MSRAQQVRHWLATQDGPRTTAQIGAGVGVAHWKEIAYVVHSMKKDGYLVAEKVGAKVQFTLGKPRAERVPQTRDEYLAKRRESERARQRARGRRDRTEYLQLRAQQKRDNAAAQREKRLAYHRAKREAERANRPPPTLDSETRRALENMRRTERRRAQRALERASRPAPEPVRQIRVERLEAPPAPKPEAPRETIEQWMARTGQQPERLPMHACSQPLRFIGHRTENDRTWRERQRQEATA